MPFASIWLASLMGAAHLVSAQTVDFFYSQTLSLCSFEGSSLNAGDTTSHGGVCAYRADTARVYACPAPDPYCWNFAEQCSSSGLGQTVCNRAGTVWCCNAIAGETCTTTQNQINVCISNFTSPNSGVSISQANQTYLSAIGVRNVTATRQTADPTPFSTRQLNAAAQTSSSSSSSSSSSTRSRSATTSGTATGSTTQTTSGTAAAQSTSGTSAPVSANSSNSGISGGAIAGIVVGVIAAIAIIGAVVFFVMRRKRSTSQSQSAPLNSEAPPQSGMSSAYGAGNEKKQDSHYSPGIAPSELGSEGHGRVEMPVSGTHAQPPQVRYEMA